MILTKLQEALAEVGEQRTALDAQRLSLDEVEAQIRIMVAKLAGGPKGPAGTLLPGTSVHFIPAPKPGRDKLDEIADILRAEGKPLHITVIAERLSAIKGKQIERTQIEPGINRHIQKANHKRIAKFAPSVFGLPEWKLNSAQEQLIEVA